MPRVSKKVVQKPLTESSDKKKSIDEDRPGGKVFGQEKRNTPMFLASLLALQFWAMVFAGNALLTVQFEQYQPFGNASVGDATANSLALLIPVLIFTFVLIFLIRIFPQIFRLIVIAFPLAGL